MVDEIRLNDLPDRLGELSYPIDRDAAAGAFDGVTLLLADGEADLGGLIRDVPQSRYRSSADLVADLHTTLPRGAVGEPYQSEGDA